MSYPNLPLGGADWQRRAAQAINYLLNQVGYIHIKVDGMPSAGQSLFKSTFAVPITLLQAMTVGRSDVAAASPAAVTLKIGGATAGTIAFAAGATEAIVSLTTTRVPALTEFEVIAPNPQDATLSDLIIEIATEA